MDKKIISELASEILTTDKNLFYYKNFPLVDHINIDKVAKGTLEVLIQTNENLYNQQKTVLQSEVNKFLHSLNLLEDDTDLVNSLCILYNENSNVTVYEEQIKLLLNLGTQLKSTTLELNDVIKKRIKL
jgi:hypothetical protein